MNTYRTIVADPPWPYATPGGGPLQSSPTHRPKMWKRHRAGERVMFGSNMRNHYPPMKLDAIKALPVESFVKSNAHLYLWATNGFLVEAHEVARAWGFRPVTVITWTKVKADGQPSMKTGYYFRGATEHVIFAVRGSMRLRTTRGVSTALLAPRGPRHSTKPEAFYSLVRQCSPGPYLELFARQDRRSWGDWDVWGDEVESDVTMP